MLEMQPRIACLCCRKKFLVNKGFLTDISQHSDSLNDSSIKNEEDSNAMEKGKPTNQFVFWLLNEFFQLLYSSQSSVSVVFPSNPPKKI